MSENAFRFFAPCPRGLAGALAEELALLGARSFIDVISPCVAFNNHEGSTRSYDYVREHNEAVNRLDVISVHREITAGYAPGSVQDVRQHDASIHAYAPFQL